MNKKFGLLGMVLFIILVFPVKVLGCSCVGQSPPEVAFEDAEYVFMGRVVRGEACESSYKGKNFYSHRKFVFKIEKFKKEILTKK